MEVVVAVEGGPLHGSEARKLGNYYCTVLQYKCTGFFLASRGGLDLVTTRLTTGCPQDFYKY